MSFLTYMIFVQLLNTNKVIYTCFTSWPHYHFRCALFFNNTTARQLFLNYLHHLTWRWVNDRVSAFGKLFLKHILDFVSQESALTEDCCLWGMWSAHLVMKARRGPLCHTGTPNWHASYKVRFIESIKSVVHQIPFILHHITVSEWT